MESVEGKGNHYNIIKSKRGREYDIKAFKNFCLIQEYEKIQCFGTWQFEKVEVCVKKFKYFVILMP